MFTQFFGSYLLHNKIVSPENLRKALEMRENTRVKLGVLAINAGYMTAKQVDAVHAKQATVDKRIGDIAVDMGYLTTEQVEELLSSQKTGCLILGQALVDLGCLTNEELEKVLKAYKEENKLDDSDFKDESDDKANSVISSFYNIDCENPEFYSIFANVLFKNVVRFVGDDFTPVTDTEIDIMDTAVVQNINGEVNLVTAISGNDEAVIGFASRFANEEITENDEYAKDVMSEFLNLSNGLFTVNISNNVGKELNLTPQVSIPAIQLKNIKSDFVLNVPVVFPFGTVTFTVAVV